MIVFLLHGQDSQGQELIPCYLGQDDEYHLRKFESRMFSLLDVEFVVI